MHRTVFEISGSHVFFHNMFTSHVSFCDWWPMGIKGRNRWKWFLIVQLNQIHFIYIGRKSQSSRLSGVRTTPPVLRSSIPVRKTCYNEKQYIKSIRSIIFVCLHASLSNCHISVGIFSDNWQSTPENLQREGSHGGEEGGNGPKRGFISHRTMTTLASTPTADLEVTTICDKWLDSWHNCGHRRRPWCPFSFSHYSTTYSQGGKSR